MFVLEHTVTIPAHRQTYARISGVVVPHRTVDLYPSDKHAEIIGFNTSGGAPSNDSQKYGYRRQETKTHRIASMVGLLSS